MEKAPDRYPAKGRKEINRILDNSNLTKSSVDVEFTRASSDENSLEIRRIQNIRNIAQKKNALG